MGCSRRSRVRDFAMVSPRMWLDPRMDALRQRGPEGPSVLSYLKTSPHSNMIGLFWQPIPYMGYESGLGEDGASRGLQFCMDAGFCDYDSLSRMVWVFDMAAEQIAEQLSPKDSRCKGVQNAYNALPPNRFLGPFFDRYAAAFSMTQRRGEESEIDLFGHSPIGPLQAPPTQGKGKGKGKGEGEGEENTPQPPRGSSGGSPSAEFQAFWATWPASERKGGKAECLEVWEKNRLAVEAAAITEHVKAMALTEGWTKQNRAFVPAPVVYLRGRRWDGAELANGSSALPAHMQGLL